MSSGFSEITTIEVGKTYLDSNGYIVTILCECKHHYKTFIGETCYGYGSYDINGKPIASPYNMGYLIKECSPHTRWVVVFDTGKNEIYKSEPEAQQHVKEFYEATGRKVLKIFSITSGVENVAS